MGWTGLTRQTTRVQKRVELKSLVVWIEDRRGRSYTLVAQHKSLVCWAAWLEVEEVVATAHMTQIT